MYGLSDYTYYSALKRKRTRESAEIASACVGFVYVAKRWADDRMLGYHALPPAAPTRPLDDAAPHFADWTDDQIVDYCAHVLALDDPPRVMAARRRLFRLAELHGDAAKRPVLDLLARALFHCLAPAASPAFRIDGLFPSAPARDLSTYSMLDVHAAIVAVQCSWFRVVHGPPVHTAVQRLLERIAEIVSFAWDPPGAVLDHPLWVADGAPSSEFTLLGLSFLVDYLRVHRRLTEMSYEDATPAVGADEGAAARRWLAGAMADADVYDTFKKRYDVWLAAPGLFGMYRTTTREFAYIEVSTATVKKRTCLTKIYPRLATIVRTPPAEVAALVDDEDPLRAACGDAAILCAIAAIAPQYNNANLFQLVETHDFFDPPCEAAPVVRIGGTFFFRATRTRVHGLLPALKYWLPSLLNGEQLLNDIFVDGCYRGALRTQS